MGMKFLATYVALAAGSGALVWYFAPTIGEKLPLEVRARICSVVDSTTSLFKGLSKSEKPISTPQNGKVVQQKSARVRPVDLKDATWGVLKRVTPVEELDGKPIGNAPSGRFFMIKETVSATNGLKVAGTFISQKITRTVRIPADNIYCFSGTPDLLPTNQLASLGKYYQLAGEAEALRSKLQQGASSSPYLQDAAAALRQLRSLEKTAAERKSTADADTLRKITYEVSRLRVKVQELNQKHKDWKAKHASQQPDPEKDPAHVKILRQLEKCAEPIRDLLP